MIFPLFLFAASLLPHSYDRAQRVAIAARTVATSEPSLFGNTYEGRLKTAKLLVTMVVFEADGYENITGDFGTSFGPMMIKPDTWLNLGPKSALAGFEYPDLFNMEYAMRGGLRILHDLRERVSAKRGGDPQYRNVRSYLLAYASGSFAGNEAAKKTIDARCAVIGGCT